MDADLMVVTFTAVVVGHGCDLVSIAHFAVRALLASFLVVVGNPDKYGLFDYDLVQVTRVLRATRSFVDSNTTAF